MDREEVLKLFKMALGFTNEKRDELYRQIITSGEEELRRKGIQLEDTAEDTMLLCDFAAWKYSNLAKQSAMPKNLLYRIRNRKIGGRADV